MNYQKKTYILVANRESTISGGKCGEFQSIQPKVGSCWRFFINGNFTLEIFKQKAWTEHIPLPKRHMYGICMVYLIFAYHVTYHISYKFNKSRDVFYTWILWLRVKHSNRRCCVRDLTHKPVSRCRCPAGFPQR